MDFLKWVMLATGKVLDLGLTGMEFLFFVAADLVLYFVFVTKTVLLVHQCFGYC